MLLLFGAIVFYTTSESAGTAYRERVVLVRSLAARVDTAVRHSLFSLQREADILQLRGGLRGPQQSRLRDLRLGSAMFSGIHVVDGSCETVWSDYGPNGGPHSPMQCSSLRSAIESGKSPIAEMASPRGADLFSTYLVAPMSGPDGQFEGAVIAELDAHNSDLSLGAAEVSEGIFVQLMNDQGRLLAGTGGLNARQGLEHKILLEDLIRSRSAGYRIHGAGSTGHVVAYAPVDVVPAWGVVIEQRNDLVLAMARHLQQRLAFFGLAALALATIGAWINANRVARPLTRLTEAAQRFAAWETRRVGEHRSV